ncbi:MAG: iron-siderophore ABC transporter substrate-binding protein [Rhodococcus sp. (in: high G+C Gram-positive bacteria)]
MPTEQIPSAVRGFTRLLRRRRSAAVTVVALLLGVSLLAACGSSNAESDSGETYSVEHVYGTTEVPRDYQRVVSVGYTDDQTMLAVGVTPVGMVDQYPAGGSPDRNISWPWVRDRWAGAVPEVVLTNGEALNFEKVAALQPDLIVGVYSDITEDDYRRLSAIAPTVAWAPDVADPFAAPWQDTARQIAKALGKEAEAEASITGITDDIAEAKADHPEFADRKAVAFSWYDGSLAPFASTDVRGKLLTDLGYQPVAEIDRAAGDKFYTTLSAEQAHLLDVDRAFFIGDAADRAALEADPMFTSLPIYREGRVTFLADSEDPPVGAALSQSTILSLPYAIDQVS